MNAIIRQFATLDIPSRHDYIWNPSDEFAGIKSAWPTDKVKVWDQGSTPACTFFSIYQLINGYNLLEDDIHEWERPQIDPIVPWNLFCTERKNFTSWYSIQWAAQKAKVAGKIEWWSTIPSTLLLDEQIKRMKKALDMTYFISTGSSNGDWTKTKKTKVYTLRTDGKFVGHGWSIVDYDDSKSSFIALNSRGPLRANKGYFYVPFNLVGSIYSKLVIVDKDDSWYFQKLKDRSKAMELVRDLKAMYSVLPVVQQLAAAAMADYLRATYAFTDADLLTDVD